VSELPPGWAKQTLGEIGLIQLGKMLDKVKNKGTPTKYLRNINVRWGAFDLTDLEEMRVTDVELARFTIEDGDLLICEGGEPGRCAVWVDGSNHLAFQKALLRFRPLEGVSSEWVANALKLKAANGDLKQYFTGTTIKHLPAVSLGRVSVPVPPVGEQRRIVAKLDTLFSCSNRARAELHRVAALCGRCIERIIGDAFDKHRMLGWKQKRLEEWVDDALIGLVRSKEQQSAVHGTPYIRMNHFNINGTWNQDSLTFISCTASESSRYELEEGDILFNTRNSYELVGKVGMWPPARPGHGYNNNLLRIRFASGILPSFAFYQMRSPAFRDYLQTQKSATTNVAAIYQRSLMRAPFAAPSLEEQQALVRRITQSFARLDPIAGEARSAAALLDRLDQAILAKAFRGELVPQDPNDEAASVLLDSIHATRAAESKPATRRQRLPRMSAGASR
jgi:type I restriction enzyme S subunit